MNCQTCGACCAVAESPQHIGVTEEDYQRLPEGLRAMVVETPTYRSLSCFFGRCCALSGQVGSAVSCVVYEQRPEVCRKFEVGSPGCLSARAEMGVTA